MECALYSISLALPPLSICVGICVSSNIFVGHIIKDFILDLPVYQFVRPLSVSDVSVH